MISLIRNALFFSPDVKLFPLNKYPIIIIVGFFYIKQQFLSRFSYYKICKSLFISLIVLLFLFKIKL